MLVMATHTWEASMWEVEAEGSGISGHLQLQREFKTSLGYPRLNQRKKRKEKKEKDLGIQGYPRLLRCTNPSVNRPAREARRGRGYPGSVVLTTYIPSVDPRGCQLLSYSLPDISSVLSPTDYASTEEDQDLQFTT